MKSIDNIIKWTRPVLVSGFSAALLVSCGGGGGGGDTPPPQPPTPTTNVPAGTMRVHFYRFAKDEAQWGVYSWAGPKEPSTGWPGSILTDTEAPTTSANLKTMSISTSAVSFSWAASADNTAVAGYVIRRNGEILGSTPNTSYTDDTVSASMSYSYTVQAFDAAIKNFHLQ